MLFYLPVLFIYRHIIIIIIFDYILYSGNNIMFFLRRILRPLKKTTRDLNYFAAIRVFVFVLFREIGSPKRLRQT